MAKTLRRLPGHSPLMCFTTVITSYSIHYTKLYEIPALAGGKSVSGSSLSSLSFNPGYGEVLRRAAAGETNGGTATRVVAAQLERSNTLKKAVQESKK